MELFCENDGFGFAYIEFKVEAPDFADVLYSLTTIMLDRL